MADIDVDAYIELLRRSLPYVPPFPFRFQIRALHQKGEFAGVVRLIRSMMNVEARIVLHWTSNASAREAKAWVTLPKDMPAYGTQAFKNMKLDMFILKSFAQRSSFHEFLVVVAHEFSHIILESIKHPLRTEEKAVDLTAMLLGFSYSYRLAAHAVRAYPGNILETVRIGYLTDDELNVACRIMLPQRFRLMYLTISFLRVGWGWVILLGMCIGAWLLGARH